MPENVTADAQFGIAKILKPYPGFEAVYQGQSLDLGIAFPGGDTGRDPDAGSPGFASNLMLAADVPFGARMLFWIPIALTEEQGGGVTAQSYAYTFVWRLRNVRDFRQRRTPYHFPRQQPGAADPTDVTNPARFVIPAAVDPILYEQAEPAAIQAKALQNAYPQSYVIGSQSSFEPGNEVLLADGTRGIMQQGILDPTVVPPFGSGGAIYFPLWMDAAGDQVIIIVERAGDHGVATWDFTDPTADLPFSDLYGTGNGTHEIFPDIGIYMFSGSNP